MGKAKSDSRDYSPRIRQKKFVDEYMTNGQRGTAAALAAGYSPKSAHISAYTNLHSTVVKKLFKKRFKLMDKELDMGFSWKMRKLKKVIDTAIPEDHSFENDIMNLPINEKIVGDAIRCIAEMNKMEGHYAPERVINANMDAKDLDDIKALVSKFRRDV